MTIPKQVLHHWKQSLSAYKTCLDDSTHHVNSSECDRRSGEAWGLNWNIAKKDPEKPRIRSSAGEIDDICQEYIMLGSTRFWGTGDLPCLIHFYLFVLTLQNQHAIIWCPPQYLAAYDELPTSDDGLKGVVL